MSSLLFTLLVAGTLLSISQAETCNPEDKKALLQIKKDFGSPYLLASWKNDTDCCTDWYQVKCNSTTNRIISVTIFSGNVSGFISPAFGNLPYLQMLDLNHLTGVTGTIQPAISKLTRLTFLRLQRLKLTGTIPPSLGKLTKLTFMDLSHNNLTGKIPPSFTNIKSATIYLSHNKLDGDAYMLFGSDKSSSNLDLSSNVLAFNFSNVVFQSSLTGLDISHNKIFGGLPKQLTQLNLQSFNVSHNKLCGQIPVGGKLQSFDKYVYLYNKCLCGNPLPSCT